MSKFNPLRFPNDSSMQAAFETMLKNTPTIHQAVATKMEFLMKQAAPSKAMIGFIYDCIGWTGGCDLEGTAERRAERLISKIEAGELSQDILVEAAGPVITHLAYLREGARERQMESPDEPVISTKDWWTDRTPGYAFA